MAGAPTDGSFASDWQDIRADGDIQYGPVDLPAVPEPPDWLKELGEWLSWLFRPIGKALEALGRALGISGHVLVWALVAIGVALAALLVWRLLSPALQRRRKAAEDGETPWTPDTAEALGLLEDADRLATEGRYNEATHLLLQRSVSQIEAAHPGLLEPSSTAREIATLPALPEAARRTFATIAERVERSLFALRSLTAEDWQEARAAYAEFALSAPQAPA